MAVAALKQKPILKIFHATVHVTRTGALKLRPRKKHASLLSVGAGYRCDIGDM